MCEAGPGCSALACAWPLCPRSDQLEDSKGPFFGVGVFTSPPSVSEVSDWQVQGGSGRYLEQRGLAGISVSPCHVRLPPSSGAQPAGGAGFRSWPHPLPAGPVSLLWAQAPEFRGVDTSNKALVARGGWEPRPRWLQGCGASRTLAGLLPGEGAFLRPAFS